MQFKDLEIIEPILKALKEEQYIEPTSIQEKAIPLILHGNDVLGSAQTGQVKQLLLLYQFYNTFIRVFINKNTIAVLRLLLLHQPES